MDIDTELEKFLEDVKHVGHVHKVNNEIALFQNTGDARFFWRAFLLIRKAGKPVPENFLDKLAQWGGRLLSAQTPAEIAAALELTGDDKKHVGPKQSAAYRRRWMLASEVKTVQRMYRVKLSDAIASVARNRGFSVSKVKRDYHAVFTAPMGKSNPRQGGTLDDAMRSWR